MKREFITTGDGSVTIHLPDWNEQYHSKHGAIAEARHVFIESGLSYCLNRDNSKTISILEIGFGTGLNAFLTLLYGEHHKVNVKYFAVEAYPIALSEIDRLNYTTLLHASENDFKRLHSVPWEISSEIKDHFQLTKRKQHFSEINEFNQYHLIYFDAFGPRVQPDLWTEEIFTKMYNALKEEGVLVTYSAKGSVRRAMQSVGFTVERLPGPPGKREMLRGTKHSSSPQMLRGTKDISNSIQ